MNSQEKEEYKKALEIVEDLYPSAHVLAKAQVLIREDDVSIDQLTELLKQDVAVTADVIRVSNSAFYGYSEPSKDLSTSINRVGMDELLKIVSLVVTKKMYHQDMVHYNMSAEEYWSQSISAALLMEWICMQAGENSQEGYTIGLLSVLGKTVINRAFGMFGDEYCYEGSVAVEEWERDLLGFDHGHAGSVLLKKWEFPVDLISPVKYQFDPESDPNDIIFTGILSFSRKLQDLCGSRFENEDYVLDDSMIAFLAKQRIEESALRAGVSQAKEKYGILKSELRI